MFKKTICIIFLGFFLFPATSHAKPYKVALFIPGQSPFWVLVTNFMQEAANDLKIELRIYDAQSNHLLMIDQVKEAIYGPNKVDAIVFQNFKMTAPHIIQLAEKAKVYAYLFNSPVQQESNLGKPREKYKYWLGEMLPDDTGAAAAITTLLIDEAKIKGKISVDGKVHLVAISGRIADTASIYRIAGIEKAVSTRTDVILHQVFNTDWGSEDSALKSYGALSRYPETKVFFSASYRITDGILDSLSRIHLDVGKDIFTNSIGLTEDTLNQVAKGEIVATSGGHYIEAAWVLVQIYDYLHGIDFSNETVSRKTSMPIISKENVDFFISSSY